MIPVTESESARRGGANPFLIIGELEGHALWSGSRARLTLGEDAGGLLRVQSRFLEHFFRLQKMEHNLSSLAQAARPPAGVSAVRQLERERKRLGRDLHTGVGQLLAAIRLQLEVIGMQLPDPPPAVRTALDRIAGLASDAGEQVRALSRWLHPPEWQRLSLEAAIRQVWETSGVEQRYTASLRMEPLPREPEQEAKVLVYRAVQEAPRPDAAFARYQSEPDAGTGGARRAAASRGQRRGIRRRAGDGRRGYAGIGLRSIREQAAALGGRLDMRSGAGGTQMDLMVPYELPRA